MSVPELEGFIPKTKKQQAEERARAIEGLQQEGFIVHKPRPSAGVAKLDLDAIRGDRYRVGIVSDTHFGSKFQQPTYLNQHLRYMKRKGVQAILVPGDVTDGSTQMHPGFEYELFAHGADAQERVALERFPSLGIPYWFIGGNHDASHFKAAGHDVVKAICDQREDFNYLDEGAGNHKGSIGYVELGGLKIQMCHPHLGGTRVRSYRMELWVEAMSPENKPHVVIMGNFHKVLQMDYRNTFGLMVPSYQAQSTWMASKGIQSYIGGCILEFGKVSSGIAPSINVEWLIERVPVEDDW
jgi:predicted phosphodiesterase